MCVYCYQRLHYHILLFLFFVRVYSKVTHYRTRSSHPPVTQKKMHELLFTEVLKVFSRFHALLFIALLNPFSSRFSCRALREAAELPQERRVHPGL